MIYAIEKPKKIENAKKLEFRNGKFYKYYAEKYIEKNIAYGQKNLKNITNNISKVCSVLNDDKLQKILLYGEVQSGKTDNMIFLTQTLFDQGYKKIILFTGTTKKLSDQNYQRFRDAFCDDITFTRIEYSSGFWNNTEKKEIIYGLKQNIHKLIDSLNTGYNSYLEDLKIAVLDDEGDEASSVKGKNSTPTNESIRAILELDVKKAVYFSITATPYVNLTANHDVIKPDYVIPLERSKKYCGLTVFNNMNSYKIVNPEIEEYFAKINTFTDCSKSVKQNLKKILLDFLQICYLHKENYQFLINPGLGTNDIKVVHKIFDNLLKDIIWSPENESLDMYVEDVNDFIKFIRKVKVKKTYNGEEYIREERPEVIVGGRLLSRGVTFEMLLYEIILCFSDKSEPNADTFLQRARWFGYREKYIEHMKIFTSSKGKTFYTNMQGAELDVRNLYKDSFRHKNIYKDEINKIFEKWGLKWTI